MINPQFLMLNRLRPALIALVVSAGLAGVAGQSAAAVQSHPDRAPGARSRRANGQLPKGSVWVVNRDRGELVIFDARSGKVLATREVGRGAHDICISERAGKAYIAAESINAVTTVDLRTLETASIPVAPMPHHVEPSPDGRTIYVSLASHTSTSGTPLLAVIDTRDDSVTYMPTSLQAKARAHGPALSHDGQTVYVAHDLGDEVAGISTETGAIEFALGPILRAEEPVATRDGRSLWVSSRGDGSVKRIDLKTHKIVGLVGVGGEPESVMLTPNEDTLVVSPRSGPAALAFVDTRNEKLLGTVQIGGAGTFGDLAAITDDGRYVYATFDAMAGGTGGVAVVNVKSRTVEATWAYPGTGRPHGLSFSRQKVKRRD